MNFPQLAIRGGFGLCGNYRDCIVLFDSFDFIYAVGGQIVIHNLSSGKVDPFPRFNGANKISAMTISKDHKYLAVCEFPLPEQSDQMAIIYHIAAKRILKSLQLHSSAVSVCAFSSDSMYFAVQYITETSNDLLQCWKWENESVIATANINQTINRVSFHPKLPNLILTSGTNYLKFQVISSDSVLRSHSIIPDVQESTESYVDHCWFMKQYLLILTDKGFLYSFRINSIEDISKLQVMKIRVPDGSRMTTIKCSDQYIAVGGSGGYFALFDFSEDQKNPLKLINKFIIPEHPVIQSFCFYNLGMELLIVTEEPKCYKFLVSWADNNELAEDERFLYGLYQGLHSSPIVALDTCIHKPFLVSCSSNNTICVWNYQNLVCFISYTIRSQPNSISLHPSGLYAVVCTYDIVTIYYILRDTLLPYHNYTTRQNTCAKYSNGGGILCVASNFVLMIYNSYSLELITQLSGHLDIVSCLKYNMSDSYLYSTGKDGAIYVWDLHKMTKIDSLSNVTKGCRYFTMTISSNEVIAYGSDKYLKFLTNGDVHSHTLDFADQITFIQLSPNEKYIFIGTSKGSIFIYQYPFSPILFSKSNLHKSAITSIQFTYDGVICFVGAEDGSILMLAVDLTAPIEITKGFTLPHYVDWSLCTVEIEELNNKMGEIELLKKSIEVNKADNKVLLNKEKTLFHEQIKAMTIEYERRIKALEGRVDSVNTDYFKYQEEIRQKKEEEMSETVRNQQTLESIFETKINEYRNTIFQLEESLISERQEKEECRDNLTSQHNLFVEELISKYTSQTNGLQKQLDEANEIISSNNKTYDEKISQSENDYEFEIRQLKKDFEMTLESEKASTLLQLQDLNKVKCQYEQLQVLFKDNKNNEQKLITENTNLKKKIQELKSNVTHVEHHLSNRDDDLKSKENEIQKLKVSNEKLNNFKFILDTRITQLEDEKVPLTNHATDLEQHIEDMYSEFVDNYQHIQNNDIELEVAKQKVDSLNKEVIRLRNVITKKEKSNEDLFLSISRCVREVPEKEKINELNKIYRVYILKNVSNETKEELKKNSGVAESSKCISVLETKLQQLEHKNKIKENLTKMSFNKSMTENTFLLSEINDLKRQLNDKEMQINQLKLQIKTSEKTIIFDKSPKLKHAKTLAEGDTNMTNNNSSFPKVNQIKVAEKSNSLMLPNKKNSTFADLNLYNTNNNSPINAVYDVKSSRLNNNIRYLLSQLDNKDVELQKKNSEISTLKSHLSKVHGTPSVFNNNVVGPNGSIFSSVTGSNYVLPSNKIPGQLPSIDTDDME